MKAREYECLANDFVVHAIGGLTSVLLDFMPYSTRIPYDIKDEGKKIVNRARIKADRNHMDYSTVSVCH